MNRRKERFIETFVMVMFPVALLVACTTNGSDSSVNTQHSAREMTTPLSQADLTATSALPFGNTSPQQTPDQASVLSGEGQYVMVSPSLHLAIYKPSPSTSDDGQRIEPVQRVKFSDPGEMKKPEKYTFQFDSDDYNIAKQDLVQLKAHAEFLIKHPNISLTISGHTDHTGTAAHNQKLSEQRAQLVANILETYGVPESQLFVDGYGETVPVSDKLEENRRVELEYSQTLILSSR